MTQGKGRNDPLFLVVALATSEYSCHHIGTAPPPETAKDRIGLPGRSLAK